MPDLPTFELVSLLVPAGAIALAVLWLLGLAERRRRRSADLRGLPGKVNATFLFHDDRLVDTDAAHPFLPGSQERGIESWADLRTWLDGRFGTLPDNLSDIARKEPCRFGAARPDDGGRLTVSAKGQMRKVVLTDTGTDAGTLHQGRLRETALTRLAAVLDKAPCAIHVTGSDGETLWQNASFSSFCDDDARRLQDASLDEAGDRVRLPGQGTEQDRYFELLRQDGNGIDTLYATDVTKVVNAERVRREFVQTLTKTFANLTTGLAVFDRQKQLALFNPSLLDLTGLPATFLSGRPTLTQFFDRLRDRKVLPEPKNYCDWRAQINEMVASAADGLYLEDWSLPTGLTYRVTGRPHPDGAIAFLFEDISDEITLTRRYRSQLDLRQAVLDTMDGAIAVIGSNNVVVLCNRACSDLLGVDPDTSFAEMSLGDFIAACRKRLPAEPAWTSAEEAIGARRPYERVVPTEGERSFSLRARPISGSAVMISIELDTAPAPAGSQTLPA